jgi:lipopolysaccharide/colanic/teichoic acid biosynthesis glycosyltransferase
MKNWYRHFGKRALDLCLCIPAALLLAPVIGAVAVLVRARLGSPVLFCQPRAGRGGRPFVLYKFRTMVDARDPAGDLLPDEQRLTAFGAALRRLSLDELPQLWNVLRGDMSLVGPRPDVLRLNDYSPHQQRRFAVVPGMTGLWQVSGKNRLSFQEMIELDLQYVDKRSPWMDLAILFKTVPVLLGANGI